MNKTEAMLAELTAAWLAEFGDHDLSALATDDAQPAAPALTDQVAAEIESALAEAASASTLADRRSAIERLRERIDVLPEALEQLVARDGRPIPDVVYHELLAGLDPQFDALDLLASRDLVQRRLGATRLARLAQETPLGELALHRAGELVVYEQDELVWRDVLSAVRGSSSEPALRIAYSALSHPAIEVRRRACGHLGDFPDPRHAVVLLPALQDTSASVVRAAVQALAHPGALEDAAPLEAMLATSDKAIRLDVATALARLGSPAGPTALERLVYDGDPTIRRGAAVVMGQLGDARFTPSLMQLLDDHELGVRVVGAQALAQVVGRDVAQRPDEPVPSLADQISRWKRWWDDEQQFGAAAQISESPRSMDSDRMR